jgi:VCBS repeat protein/PEP-CTERM motif-containing protein
MGMKRGKGILMAMAMPVLACSIGTPAYAVDVPFDADPNSGSILVAGADGLYRWVKSTGGGVNLGGVFTGANIGAGFAQEIDIGDIDGDGNGDILAARITDGGSQGRVAWTERNGATSLAGISSGFNVGPSNSIAVGDMDGDSNGDMVIGRLDGRIIWVERVGNNLTTPSGSFNVGGVNALAVGNLDGDGNGDVVVARPDGLITWAERNGNALSGVFTGFNVSPAVTLEIGNLDNDGNGDIVVGRADGFVTYVERSGNNLTSGVAAPSFNLGSVADLALGDVNGDGEDEIIVAQSILGGSVFVLDSNGSSISLISNAQQAVGGGDSITSLDVGYLDNDNLLDIIVGRTDGMIHWMEVSSDGSTISGVATYNIGSSVVDLRIASRVPEPASLAMLGLGGLMMFRRR